MASDGPTRSGTVVDALRGTRLVCRVLGLAIPSVSLAWAGDVPRMVGWVLYTEQFLAAVLGLALALIFLTIRSGNRDAEVPPWHDIAAAVLSIAAGAYAAIDYADLINDLSYRPAYLVAFGFVLVGLCVEALRRVVGWPLTIVVLGFMAYALVGHLVPGQLAGRPLDLPKLAVYLGVDTNGILGRPLMVASTIVIPFILLGRVLSSSGGSAFFTDLSVALMGRFRGGSAKISIVASSLFGSISGSAVSNVATTGVITIPLMRDSGYSPREAAAIEAAAFLMAEFLQISYTEVVVAAVLPALLYYFALFVLSDLEAGRRGILPIDRSEIPSLRQVLATGWHFPMPFIVLIVALFSFNLSPQTSAMLATAVLAVTGVLVGYQGKRMRLSGLVEALESTGRAVLDLILICAGAGIVIGVLNLSGLGFGLTMTLVEVGGHSLPMLLVLAAGVSILLGMGMPTVGVYVLLAALVAPALVEMGVAPIASHLFVMYFGMMSMLTPPVALAAYAAASVTGTEPMRTGASAVRFAWSAYLVPFLFVASPSLLLQGSAVDVGLAALTATAGIWVVSIGIVGYFRRPLGPLVRPALVISGLALLVPAGAFDGALWTDVAGAAVGTLLLAGTHPKVLPPP